MTKVENVRGKSTKAQYVDSAGTWLPGASTIADLLGPVGGLGYWGFQIGKSGEVDDYWAYLRGLASTGSAVHALIGAYAAGESEPDMSMYTGQEIKVAQASLEKYKGWASRHEIEFIYGERPLVSETYKYGGQPDLYLRVDKLYTILDLKSSDDVRDQHKVQTAGYSGLVLESGDPVDQLIVLPLGRDLHEPMHKPWVTTDIEPYWAIFKHLLAIYSIQSTEAKEAKKGTGRAARADAAELALNNRLRRDIAERAVGEKVVSIADVTLHRQLRQSIEALGGEAAE